VARNFKIFRFSQRYIWGFLSFGIRHRATRHSDPNFSDSSVVRKNQQKIMYWWSVMFRQNGIFCTFVWKWCISVFSKLHCVRSADIIVIILVKLL
jgi:hypothetical protein